MLRLLYSALFYIAVPFALLRLLWRSRKEPLYRASIGERFGFCSRIADEGLIWIHAVSAGETNAAAPLVNRLLDRGNSVMVTTMTPTGRQRVRALFGDRVHHCYAPYDLPDGVARFLARSRPRVLVIIDTELWPNMIHEAHTCGMKVLLVNARLSEKSARGYGVIGSLTREMLNEIDVIASQTAAQGERFVALGLDREKLTIAGSIKFDVRRPDDFEDRVSGLRERLGERHIVLGASIHPGEDFALLDAYEAARSTDHLLVLAPRHVHRVDAMAELCSKRGYEVVRHSSDKPCTRETDVYIVDTMGELMYFYGISDVAVVGGSFIDGIGGHNPMEPISLDVPVIMGRYLRNIEDIALLFRQNGGMIVTDVNGLTDALVRLLDDRAARETQIENARQVMQDNRGALDRVEKLVLEQAGHLRDKPA
jgi:3-deoxy-D-manno-octulosonic-acid transferase